MASLWHLSLTQPHDLDGLPYPGARVYFYTAGTLTPMTVFRDAGLGLAHPNPVAADGYGFWPVIYLNETLSFYKMRFTDEDGAAIPGLPETDGVPIVGPAGGVGGVVTPVDQNSLLKTGDEKWRYGIGAHSGWVRENGRTIGSATSGASERANADTEALFLYLYVADATLTVSGGRGASAAADWAANKTIALPDARGRVLAALDDMGNTAAGILTGGTSLGAAGGIQAETLTVNQTPSHAHSINDSGHNHGINPTAAQVQNVNDLGPGVGYTGAGSGASSTQNNTTGISIQNTGGGASHNNLQPYSLRTLYIKL